ncbi:hypothetical protein HPB47_009382 [Ixodes persulcatus]|uniref:Uncharacterized protein n=1 Tax=Ixodes persulcatus TaxID=34615 RepID=A0AC60P237_IXOPE|nr:hypothetical protein HPB47_009382 [Ixodes persulcatus]
MISANSYPRTTTSRGTARTTPAGRSILAKVGYPVHDLPELPQQTPPWEHIVLTDGTPLPQRIQSTGRRLPLKRRHLKYISSLDHCTHVIYVDASLPADHKCAIYATVWCNSNTEAQARHLHTTTTPPLSTQAELQAITDYARDALLTAKEDAPVTQEIANPWHDLRSTKAQRAAYLSMAANPLSIPKIPSQHFSRREAVMIRQIQTGTLLTPHLLQRFLGNDGAGSSTASGICKNCNSKADLVHLMWSCPLYNLPRQRALDLITNAPVPASLNAWACPDTTISPSMLWSSVRHYSPS